MSSSTTSGLKRAADRVGLVGAEEVHYAMPVHVAPHRLRGVDSVIGRSE